MLQLYSNFCGPFSLFFSLVSLFSDEGSGQPCPQPDHSPYGELQIETLRYFQNCNFRKKNSQTVNFRPNLKK